MFVLFCLFFFLHEMLQHKDLLQMGPSSTLGHELHRLLLSIVHPDPGILLQQLETH